MTIQLEPKLEAGLRNRAEADGVPVEDLVSRALDSYLRRAAAASVRRASLRDRSQEMAWAEHPDPACVGKWVVLEGKNVVAVGANAKLVFDEARRKGIAAPFLVFVAPDSEPFVGGWID